MKSTLDKMLSGFVDDFYLEDDPSALAYMQQLEYQKWYQEIGWMEEINSELRAIAESEQVSEYLLTNDDSAEFLAFGT